MKLFTTTLTVEMLCDLKKAREIELAPSPDNVCYFYNFHGTLTGLHDKGFVRIDTIGLDGKQIVRVKLTAAAISFLENHEKTKEKFSQLKSWSII